MMRMRASAATLASTRSMTSLGRSAARSVISSRLSAARMAWRSAKGLSRSSAMRLLADSTPSTSPAASTTGRWFTPASIITRLASCANASAPTVTTGLDMMPPTGSSREPR